VPIHKLLAEVEELKSQQEAIRLVIPLDCSEMKPELNGLEYRTAMMPSPAPKRLLEKARRGECGSINTGPRSSRIYSVKMYVDVHFKCRMELGLTSSQRVHREVMGWLKEWDKCVFKRANPVKKRRLHDDEENPYVRPTPRTRLTAGRLYG
jgi:chromosome transmission fidelity protein 18